MSSFPEPVSWPGQSPKGESPPDASARRADWQLPVGVDRALWEYLTDEQIAEDYDRYFAQTELLRTDRQFLEGHFRRPGRLVDLGCGAGRLLVHFASMGFDVVGVDLSERMLDVCHRKRRQMGLPIGLVKANMCDLSGIRDGVFDYASCMFSTLGMIVGLEQRRKALAEVQRVLRPGGLFGLHLHNRWHNIVDPQGRRWLLTDVMKRLTGAPNRGDKVMPSYRGIPNLRLHLYTRSEIRLELERAGFRVVEFHPLAANRAARLPAAWFLERFRANGWLIMAERAN